MEKLNKIGFLVAYGYLTTREFIKKERLQLEMAISIIVLAILLIIF